MREFPADFKALNPLRTRAAGFGARAVAPQGCATKITTIKTT
jgi:hypothetical protein